MGGGGQERCRGLATLLPPSPPHPHSLPPTPHPRRRRRRRRFGWQEYFSNLAIVDHELIVNSKQEYFSNLFNS